MIKINCSSVTLKTLCSSSVSLHPAIWSVRRLLCTATIQLAPKRLTPPSSGKHKLPPPPPLARLNLKQSTASSSGTTALPWKTLDEILSVFVEYVPTFYVPVQGVAAIMPEEIRAYFQGRGKLINFFRRHPFLFDMRNIESGSRIDVRLQEGVSHPRFAAADPKYMLTDIGVVESYVAKPEFIVSMDSIEISNKGVSLHPQSAPPAIRVQLEERVPVLDRLVAFIPVDFETIKKVEENIPDDILFHPYFDCQGGLASIASKFPDDFQVVDGKIRRRPPHLAPLSLNDFTLKQSPIPEIAALVEREVCDTNIPRWVNITSLYEKLTPQQKREVKQRFKSFAGFLRAHGRSVSISQDMLCISMWLPPPASSTNSADANAPGGSETCMDKAKPPHAATNHSAGPVDLSSSGNEDLLHREGTPLAAPAPRPKAVQTTSHTTFPLQVVNELYDRFPPHRSLNLVEASQLLPDSLRQRLPKNLLSWICHHRSYFVVENPGEKDPEKVRIQRASDRQPLDAAHILYQGIHRLQQGEAKGCRVSVKELIDVLAPADQQIIAHIGILNLVNMLPEWFELGPVPDRASTTGGSPTEEDLSRGDYFLRQLRSLAELEESVANEHAQRVQSCVDPEKGNE